MRSTLFLGAAAALALIATDPAICAQAAPPPADNVQPLPGEPVDPANPATAPMTDPSQPSPPITEPLPPEMPMPAGEAQQVPPVPEPLVQANTDAPIGAMATPPDSGTSIAQSGGTTSARMQPVVATKPYPLCSRTVQDSCRNPGEGPKQAKKPR